MPTNERSVWESNKAFTFFNDMVYNVATFERDSYIYLNFKVKC